MSGALLTLKEVAELEHKDYYTVTKQIQRKKLQAIKIPTDSRQGFEYRVPLKELTEKAQARYYAQLHHIEKPILEGDETPEKYEQSINDLTGEQLDEIAFWQRVIKSWRSYIAGFPKQTTEKTKEFVKFFNSIDKRPITERTLRNKYKLFKEFGEVALADHRKNRKDRNTTNIPVELQNAFLDWWLDESQPTVAFTHNMLQAWVEMDMPQLAPVPSYDSFYRLVKNLPPGVLKYYREGDKALTDDVLPYVERDYSRIDSNEIWSADYHTLDFFVKDDLSGKVFRPHVVVWIDVRSRKVLSMKLCETSNSDGVITSFRQAVKAWGLPKSVYLDNGREFLVRDFGGSGRRKSNPKANYGRTMLERLNIEMTNARVRNGRAKVIERAFKNVASEFAKTYITYTGGRPDKRPERLTGVLKDESNIPLRSEVEADLWTYLEGWCNNRASQAVGLGGQTPNACYAANLVRKRTATEDELDMITLRTSSLRKVERNGVYLQFGERKIWFYDTDLVHNYFGQKVFVCYDSEDLSQVLIRDEQERRIGYASMTEVGGYSKDMDKEAIKKVSKNDKAQRKLIKTFKEELSSDVHVPSMNEILIRKSEQNIKGNKHIANAKVIEVFKPTEVQRKVVGHENDGIDRMKMAKNAKKNGGTRI
ncbi:transposase family protein [Metasolibacillus meyeri]|uniref:Transposase family protein n=1 Tax=Metasolibacillus meyeri TaxID=1071052 RepID=A0AAW9NT76_9BACL|nr:transposase family protein [Metasolibacillus meyeri]MEC1178509.1 transposase family protein [Metasolibacillus meyeri]